MNAGIIKRSILASILIGFGVCALLYLGQPFGPIIFAFGLLSVCILKADLFTGKAGFYWRNNKLFLFYILVINLIAGWAFGYILSVMDGDLITMAKEKIIVWNISWSYFIKSILCGMIMYIAVRIYTKGFIVGIIFGVPLFIFCGFQHCIANIIIFGIAHTISLEIVIAIIGNLFGSIIINILEDN